MRQLPADVRFAFRTLARERSFSLTVLATFALCVAANVATFAVLRAVLLRPLPFPDPDQLVVMFNSYPKAGAPRAGNSVPHFLERRENLRSLRGLTALKSRDVIIGEPGRLERVKALRVTPDFFAVLGVGAQLGRMFRTEEGEEGRDGVAVLSHGFWRQEFAADPGAIGRTLRVDGVAVTVVGVMPENFRVDLAPETRLWMPLAFSAADRGPDRRHSNNLNVIGRLAPGATVARLQAEVDALNAKTLEADSVHKLVLDAGFCTKVSTLLGDITRNAASAVWLLQVAALFVLLIGAVNLANLILVRASARAKEMAIRRVLGASPARIARAIVIENALLAIGGAVLGVALGAALLPALQPLGLAQLPRGSNVRVDAIVVAGALALSLATAVVLAVPPLAQHLGGKLGGALSVESRGGTTDRRQGRWREALIIAQIALAFVLLTGAGLFTLSFARVLAVDPGFQTENLITAQISLPRSRFTDDPARRGYVRRLLAEVERLPGVQSAAVSTGVPFSGDADANVMMPEGYQTAPGESLQAPFTTGEVGDFFGTLRMPLRDGRLFTVADADAEAMVAVIDERFARRYWPKESPVGHRVRQGAPNDADAKIFTVVGVVGTVKQNDLAETVNVGAVYLTYRQEAAPRLVLTIRTEMSPTALAPVLQAAVLRVDPEVPAFDLKTMSERVQTSLGARRTPMVLGGVFAGGALLLSIVGVYGVLAYAVAQRRREIGIRFALGALPAEVHAMFLGLGARLLVVGIAVGAPLVWWMGRLLRAQLFAVEPTNAWVLAAGAGGVAVAALVAAVIPARRAAATPAMEALRAD